MEREIKYSDFFWIDSYLITIQNNPIIVLCPLFWRFSWVILFYFYLKCLLLTLLQMSPIFTPFAHLNPAPLLTDFQINVKYLPILGKLPFHSFSEQTFPGWLLCARPIVGAWDTGINNLRSLLGRSLSKAERYHWETIFKSTRLGAKLK